MRGIRHVLSQRASDALAPRTPSADDRAIHGTAGLRVAPGLFGVRAALCASRSEGVEPSGDPFDSDPIGVETPPADWGWSFSPFHAGGAQEPCGGGVGKPR